MKHFCLILFNCCVLLTFLSAQTDSAIYDKKPILFLKLTPIAFLNGYTTIGLEHPIFKRQSLEYRWGFIGLGVQKRARTQSRNFGNFGTVGYKFLIYKDNRTQPIDRLTDWYLRPEFTIGRNEASYIHRNYTNGSFTDEERPVNVDFKSITLAIGFQVTTHQKWMFDCYIGLGQVQAKLSKSGVLRGVFYDSVFRMPISGQAEILEDKQIAFKLGFTINRAVLFKTFKK
jgi:hypothetical protein